MKSKRIIFLTLSLALLTGFHETTLTFGLLQYSAMERSEEVPSRESEEHTSVITPRVFRSLVLNPGSKNHIPCQYDPAYHKLVNIRSVFFKSSLHILFLSLRN